MSSREIAEITGFAKTTIIRCASKNHLRHTEETQKRIDEYVRQRRYSGRKSYDYSKLSEKITHTRKMESWRVRSGLEQNTKYKVRITPKRIQNAMYHLMQKYGYFYETVDKTELYYDSVAMVHLVLNDLRLPTGIPFFGINSIPSICQADSQV